MELPRIDRKYNSKWDRRISEIHSANYDEKTSGKIVSQVYNVWKFK